MKYTNANSFKAKIKNIAEEKQIPAQQVQQHYLIEQLLRLISKSKYKNSFIVKGGYLIGSLIGIDKRTTRLVNCEVIMESRQFHLECQRIPFYSASNMEHLKRGIVAYNAGEFKERDLIEVD